MPAQSSSTNQDRLLTELLQQSPVRPAASPDLLGSLLAAPPPPVSTLAPIALRSTHEQRDLALQGLPRRTWVDRALRYGEVLLLVAALGVFGYWLVDGPLRDWLYTQNVRASAASAPAARPTAPLALSVPPAGAASGAVQVNAPLPFTTNDMAAPVAADYVTPREVLPAPAPATTNPLPTRLEIPTIGLDTPVKPTNIVDGAWEVADYAAGYMVGSALPGDIGNTALAGHAGLRGAVFRDLHRLTPGDQVFIDAAGWRFEYRVRSADSVWPTQVEVLDSTKTPVLTLITCTNWDTQRLVVVADLVASKPQPAN